MQSVASAAKDRLKAYNTAGSSPQRKYVNPEDAAAHAALLGNLSVMPQSQSPSHLGRPPTAMPQSPFMPPSPYAMPASPYASGGYGYNAVAASNSPLGRSPSQQAMYAQMPPSQSGSFNYPPGAIYNAYMTGSKWPAPRKGGDEEEGDGASDDGGEKVKPIVTCRLVCCYLLLLAIGAAFGMVANELQWSSILKKAGVHSYLEDLEDWLHKPHNDPAHVRSAEAAAASHTRAHALARAHAIFFCYVQRSRSITHAHTLARSHARMPSLFLADLSSHLSLKHTGRPILRGRPLLKRPTTQRRQHPPLPLSLTLVLPRCGHRC